MSNLGQVLPPQEVIIRSGRSRPSDKEGGGHPHPKIKDERRSQKNLFSALWALVWSKYKGGGPPLDLPLMRVQCVEYLSIRRRGGYSEIQVMGRSNESSGFEIFDSGIFFWTGKFDKYVLGGLS